MEKWKIGGAKRELKVNWSWPILIKLSKYWPGETEKCDDKFYSQ
jgi:hypothetical protein